MEVLTTIEAGGHTIDFGVATTRTERQAVLAQRFRVFQRQGYFRKGLRDDRDEYDREAVYFLGRLRGAGPGPGFLVGSTRLIEGRGDPGFEFPALKPFRFEMPAALPRGFRAWSQTPAAGRCESGSNNLSPTLAI